MSKRIPDNSFVLQLAACLQLVRRAAGVATLVHHKAMHIRQVIADIKATVLDTFATIDRWFDKDAGLRGYRPTDGGWTIEEILEHIALTNHFLLILIDKGARKALHNIQGLDLRNELESHVFQYDKLVEIGQPNAFDWIRPEHMQPTGTKPLSEVRQLLHEQESRVLNNLDLLGNGEGVLYKTTMTVNALGKLNLYEYMYFLAQHGRRHVTQMEQNEAEYRSTSATESPL